MGYLNNDGIINSSLLMKRANSIARENYKWDKKAAAAFGVQHKKYHEHLKEALKEEWGNVKEAIWCWNRRYPPVYRDCGSVTVSDDYIASVSTDGKLEI